MNHQVRMPAFMALFLTFGCQEIEKQLLLTTELKSKSETEMVVEGHILDAPAEAVIQEYGHCWSERGEPSITDSQSSFLATVQQQHQPFNYTSSITSFAGNKTYYIKSYVRLNDGTVRYGNTINVTSELTKGKWTKYAEHWYPPKVSTYDNNYFDCGPGILTISTHNVFASLLPYEDDIFTHGGYTVDVSLDVYATSQCSQPKNSYNGFSQWSNEVLRRWNNDRWTVKALVSTEARGIGNIAISHNGLFYFGGGGKSISFVGEGFLQLYSTMEEPVRSNFFAFDPQNNVALALNRSPLSKSFATSFAISEKIYSVGGVCGYNQSIKKCDQDLAYNTATGEWEPIAPFPGKAMLHMASFVLNGKAYVGGGFEELFEIWEGDYYKVGDYPVSPTNEFYEYDPKTNEWRRVADFPGIARGGSFCFSLNNYGYLGCGAPSYFDKLLKDFWRYDPIRDSWTQLDDFPGGRRYGAAGTTLNNKGVAGLGVRIQESESESLNPYDFDFFRVEKDVDLWIYDPSAM
jgi:N-acetylneuraminic acid mutarotase